MRNEALLATSLTRLDTVKADLQRLSTRPGVDTDGLLTVNGLMVGSGPMLKIGAQPDAGVVYPHTLVTYYLNDSKKSGHSRGEITAVIQPAPPLRPRPLIDQSSYATRLSISGEMISVTNPSVSLEQIIYEDTSAPFIHATIHRDGDIQVGNEVYYGGRTHIHYTPLTHYTIELQEEWKGLIAGHLQTVDAMLLGMMTRNPNVLTIPTYIR